MASKSAPNPVEKTFHSTPSPPPVSSHTYTIAGLLTKVYGLNELSSNISRVACLWLLHPRLQDQSCMAPIAASILQDWNARPGKKELGLIAVSFDQRNHGSRLVDPLVNEAWRSGNPRHAQDMFSCYNGTSYDTMNLLDHLPPYIFPSPTFQPCITINICLGISLGGHATWHVIHRDSRFKAGIVIIGSPDYTSLMADRARLSKLPTYSTSSPPGSSFIGSEDFPPGLVKAVSEWDPAGLAMAAIGKTAGKDKMKDSDGGEKVRMLMEQTLGGKRILCLSGGADKLVPYHCGEGYLKWLNSAVSSGGWFEGGLHLEDKVFEGVGHEVPQSMVREAVRFVRDTLELEGIEKGEVGKKESKI